MANVKGVILNGAKYESEDTEARTLADQAIGQVDILNNSVTALESGFTNLNEVVADVNQKATEAGTLANQANTLADQALTKANDAYSLANDLGHQTGLLHDTIGLDISGSWTLTEENENQLFPFIKENKANGKSFLINIWANDRKNNDYSGWLLFSVNDSSIMFRSAHTKGVTINRDGNNWVVSNNTDAFVTVIISTIMQP